MRHETGTMTGVGGVDLFHQAWLPDGEPRAVIVLAHGASEHSGRYGWVAERLVGHGHALYALDHRGHGRSGGPRAFVDRLAHVVADLDALMTFACAAHPGRPLVSFGHSFGGCVALAHALEHEHRLTALVLSAPLAALAAAPLPLRLIARALAVIAPKTGVYQVDANAVSTDPEVVRDYAGDPLNFHGKLPARTVAEIADAVGAFPARLPALTVPLLVMHSTADAIVPFAAAETIMEHAGSEDRTLQRFDGLAHEILNEPERDRVLAGMVAWLDERLPA